MGLSFTQQHLVGLEDYTCTFQCCTFQCLTHCPFPEGDCIWDDPDIGMFDQVEYPEFFGWRLEHLTDDQKRQLMETDSDMMIITPDCLDEFYLEPDPTGRTYRCNRCLSVELDWQPEWIVCGRCGWSEPLYDFPVARRY